MSNKEVINRRRSVISRSINQLTGCCLIYSTWNCSTWRRRTSTSFHQPSLTYSFYVLLCSCVCFFTTNCCKFIYFSSFFYPTHSLPCGRNSFINFGCFCVIFARWGVWRKKRGTLYILWKIHKNHKTFFKTKKGIKV